MAKKRRRPGKKNPKRTNVLLRCTHAEKSRWFAVAEQATASGQFSDWARQVLNAAADYCEKQRNRG